MSLNDNFCIIPFMVLNCRPNGTLKTCSQATNTKPIDGFNLNEDSVEDFWNSDFMVDFRKRKIAGERIPQCEGCKRTEEGGGKSKRQDYNDKFFEKYKDRISDDGIVKQMPSWWEFRLSSVCNSACRICTPANSTLIEKEHKKHYDKLPAYDKHQLTLTTKNQLGDGIFLEQFWRNVDDVDYIELHGGEPLIDENVINSLSRLVEKGKSKDIKIHIHSNINILTDEVLELLNQFEGGWFGASIDAYGEENDFLRWPSKWKKVEDNFKRVKLHEGWNKYILSSVTCYQCLTLDKLVDWYLPYQDEWKLNFYPVHAPDRFALELVPLELRLEAAEYLESYQYIMKDFSGLEGIINTLKSIRVPDKTEYEQFVMFNDAMDDIRKQKSKQLFPHIERIYEQV